ncbi:hypothetical protein ACQY0O_004022 [Thecaphora frezii]
MLMLHTLHPVILPACFGGSPRPRFAILVVGHRCTACDDERSSAPSLSISASLGLLVRLKVLKRHRLGRIATTQHPAGRRLDRPVGTPSYAGSSSRGSAAPPPLQQWPP